MASTKTKSSGTVKLIHKTDPSKSVKGGFKPPPPPPPKATKPKGGK